jgi:hypothetical protein
MGADLWMKDRRSDRKGYLFFALVFVLLLPGASVFIAALKFIINTFPETLDNRILGLRIAMTDSPISVFGVGYTVLVELETRLVNIHNAFVAFLVKDGLLGFFAFLTVVGIPTYRFAKLVRFRQMDVLGIGLVGAIVGALVEMLAYEGGNDRIMWIFLGICHTYVAIVESGVGRMNRKEVE